VAIKRLARRWLMPLAMISALLACTTVPEREAPDKVYNGRFSLKTSLSEGDGQHRSEHLSGRFTLSVARPWTELDLASPLGNTLARLHTGTHGAWLQLPDEDGGLRTLRDGHAQALSERVLGYPLPLEGLPWWIEGMPAPARTPAQAARVHYADNGLPEHIEQDGWRIHIEERFNTPDRPTPRRLQLTHSPRAGTALQLRVVIDAP